MLDKSVVSVIEAYSKALDEKNKVEMNSHLLVNLLKIKALVEIKIHDVIDKTDSLDSSQIDSWNKFESIKNQAYSLPGLDLIQLQGFTNSTEESAKGALSHCKNSVTLETDSIIELINKLDNND